MKRALLPLIATLLILLLLFQLFKDEDGIGATSTPEPREKPTKQNTKGPLPDETDQPSG